LVNSQESADTAATHVVSGQCI